MISRFNIYFFLICLLFLNACVVEQGGIQDDEDPVTSDTTAGDEAGTVTAGDEAGTVTAGDEAGDGYGTTMSGVMIAGNEPACIEEFCGDCLNISYDEEGCCYCVEGCETDDHCPVGEFCNDGSCERPIEPRCDCDDDGQPVCAAGITFSNACYAECDGYEVYVQGECRDVNETYCFEDGIETTCETACDTMFNCLVAECGPNSAAPYFIDQDCTNFCEEDPDILEFICRDTNSCEELISLIEPSSEQSICDFEPTTACETTPENVDYYGYGEECDVIDYACPEGAEEYWDECGCGCLYTGYLCDDPLPNVEYYAYGEECYEIDYLCPDNSEYYNDECGCGCLYYEECTCPEIYNPVCTGSGDQYDNACVAECSGEYRYFSCEESCDCPTDYTPVCGLDGVTYNNTCLLECARVPLLSEGRCNQGLLCDDLENFECESVCDIAAACHIENCSEEFTEFFITECPFFCEQGFDQFLCEMSSCEELTQLTAEFLGFSGSCGDDIYEECPVDGRGANYYAYDSNTCSLIDFECPEGTEVFNNYCGCGCQGGDVCPQEGSNARYVNYEPEVCQQIANINCPEGSQVFNNDCGCGCEY